MYAKYIIDTRDLLATSFLKFFVVVCIQPDMWLINLDNSHFFILTRYRQGDDQPEDGGVCSGWASTPVPATAHSVGGRLRAVSAGQPAKPGQCRKSTLLTAATSPFQGLGVWVWAPVTVCLEFHVFRMGFLQIRHLPHTSQKHATK